MTTALLGILAWLAPAIPFLLALILASFFAKRIARAANMDAAMRIWLIRALDFAYYGLIALALLVIAASFFALSDAQKILSDMPST
jgi:hypothetical protein